MSVILDVADALEADILTFLEENENGGKFILPDCNTRELTFPLMILTFEQEGWDVEYDFSDKAEWLEFKRFDRDFITSE